MPIDKYYRPYMELSRDGRHLDNFETFESISINITKQIDNGLEMRGIYKVKRKK